MKISYGKIPVKRSSQKIYIGKRSFIAFEIRKAATQLAAYLWGNWPTQYQVQSALDALNGECGWDISDAAYAGGEWVLWEHNGQIEAEIIERKESA